MSNKRIVYSTDPGWKDSCPDCGESVGECSCKKNDSQTQNQVAGIRRETKGRGGKTVTTISGLRKDLKSVQKALQKHCGSGGTLKGEIIEIQGDHREKIAAFLQQKGYKTKFTGG